MTVSRLYRRITILFVCTLITLGCSPVKTDKVPTYSINFGTTSTQTLSQDITFTRLSDNRVFDYSQRFTHAAGNVSKHSLFGDEAMETAYPDYCEILLLPANSSFSLGFGGKGILRFRIETAQASDTILDVEPDDREFWIDESSMYDNYSLISEGKIHIQYIMGASDGTLSYYSASEGTATLIKKSVTPYDSNNGTLSLEIDFNDILMEIDNIDYRMDGLVTLSIEATDND